MFTKHRIIVSIIIVVSCCWLAHAVPAPKVWQTKSQPDGTTIVIRLVGDEFYHYWENQEGNIVQQDESGFWRVIETKPTRALIQKRRQASNKYVANRQKQVGTMNMAQKGLVILVNFQDVKFNNANTQAAMNDLMNSTNYTYNGAAGSVRQYFSDQSDGQYTPNFDVVGPVTLPNSRSYYGKNNGSDKDIKCGDLVQHACSIANASCNVDYTQYDNDGDGEVDFVYILYAGKGEAAGGGESSVWPHSWSVYGTAYYGYASFTIYNYKNYVTFDGKTVDAYACSAELNSNGERCGIGTIAHEFSHVIGLPDYYDTGYGTNDENGSTPNTWHIMDHGSYNNDENTPPNYSIYDKYFLGWKTPLHLGDQPQNITLQPIGTAQANGYQITTSGTQLLGATSTTTHYYVENRQKSGWDAYLPGHGMLIWQVKYNATAWNDNEVNNTAGNPRFTLVSAKGSSTDLGTGADPFPGTGKVTSWNQINSRPLLNIKETNNTITFTYIREVACHNVLTNGTGCTITPSSDCVTNGATLTANIIPADASYDITSISVKLGNTTLTKDTHYTLSNNNQFITIKGTAITGDASNALTITATATKNRWNYEVLYENATVSSEAGAVAKGGTLTLTVTPALGYVLDNTMIEVEQNGSARTFTYSGTTLTISNVQGDLGIYIMPETDPENAITFTRLTNAAMLQPGAKCILVYAEIPAVAGQMNKTWLTSVTDGFTTNGDKTEITTQKTNTDISIFTLGGSTDAWTLTNSEGKKLSGTSSALGWDGTNKTWTISVGNDGKTVMTVGGTQLYYNASSPRFRTYTNAQNGMYLYVNHSGEIVKQDPVITFSKQGNQTIPFGQTFSNPAVSTYGTVTYSSSDETIATVNSSGVVTPKKLGTVTITASVAEGTYNNAASASYQLTITPVTTTITFGTNNKTIYVNDTYTNTVTTNSSGNKHYTSSSPEVATIDQQGKVTAHKAGTTTITLNIEATSTHTLASATYTLIVQRRTANARFTTTIATLIVGETYTATVNKDGHDGAITFTSSNAAVATIDSKTGEIKALTQGSTIINVTLSQTDAYNEASHSFTLQVTEPAQTLYQVTWIVDGMVLTDADATHRYKSGEALRMPSTEVGACSGMEFVGWTAMQNYSNPFCPPTDLFDSPDEKNVTANVTYYAVFRVR